MTAERSSLPAERRRGGLVPGPALDPAPLPDATRSDLSAFGGILRRRKWTILGGFLVVVLVVAAITKMWPETYVSKASILLNRPQAGGDIPGLTVLERLDRAGTLETEVELVRSRRVIGPIVDSLDLHATATVDGRSRRPAEVFPAFEATPEAGEGAWKIVPDRDGWRVTDAETDSVVLEAAPGSGIELPGVALTLPESPVPGIVLTIDRFDAAVEDVRDRVDVSPASQDGDILEIDCQAGTPGLAREICGSVVEGYLSMRSRLQRSEAGVTADFLRDQVEDYGARLEAAEDSLEVYAAEHRGVALGEQASEEVRNLAQIRAQRDQLQAQRRALSGLIRGAERAGGGASYRDLASFPAFLGNQTMSTLMAHLSELENRRSELAQRRTSANPELAAIDRRIGEIERQIGRLASSYERSLSSEISSLEGSLGSSSGRLASLPERQVEMSRLDRKVASLTEIHGLLETRLREAEMAESIREPNVRVVDEATLPIHPSSPKPVVNMALAVALGLGLGLALAFLRELRDDRIHDRAALERRVDLPVLALIPHMRAAGPVLPVGSNGHAIGPGNGTKAPLWRRDPEEERAVALEAFRSLGTDLHLISRRLEAGDIRSIAVSSAGRGEGKTLVACNLALARASYGVHTLLIDADMRAGGVSRFFRLADSSPGLSELLSGSTSASETRRTVAVDGSDSISILPAGARTADAAELLESSYFEAMLAGAQAVYDCVVLDTPPIGLLSDTSVIVQSVDAVLLVVREDVTDWAALELSLKRLRRAGGPLVGVVYNDVALPKAYAYGYGSRSDA